MTIWAIVDGWGHLMTSGDMKSQQVRLFYTWAEAEEALKEYRADFHRIIAVVIVPQYPELVLDETVRIQWDYKEIKKWDYGTVHRVMDTYCLARKRKAVVSHLR